MAIKKSELYSSLWKSCDELRGGMDASQYKDYVLVLLFVKYVSDKYAGQPNALIEVPEGGSFTDMVALKGDKEIGDIPVPKEKERGWRVEAEFVDAIRTGSPIQFTDFATGVAYMEFTEAVALSAEREEPIDLPIRSVAEPEA